MNIKEQLANELERVIVLRERYCSAAAYSPEWFRLAAMMASIDKAKSALSDDVVPAMIDAIRDLEAYKE